MTGEFAHHSERQQPCFYLLRQADGTRPYLAKFTSSSVHLPSSLAASRGFTCCKMGANEGQRAELIRGVMNGQPNRSKGNFLFA